MSHLFRFFGRELTPGTWTVDQGELEHMRKVLRLKVGDTIEVMNGQGSIAQGELMELAKDHASVAVQSVTNIEKPSIKKALAIGALKPGDLDDILSDLVELGIDEVHVFQQSDTAKFRTGDKQERWNRILHAAVKQCKTAWCPKIFVHDSLGDTLKILGSFEQRFVLDAAGQTNLLKSMTPTSHSIALIIGSERGLNHDEIVLCQNASFELVKMGENILRARTAAIAAAAILSSICI